MAGLEIASLRDLNALPGPLCEGLYARLVPAVLLDRVGVDPRTGANGQGERLLRVTAPPDQSWARVELRMAHEDRDPLLLVDVEIGPFGVPELSFVQIADPRSERFDIDYDGEGRDTLFGTVSRNLPEERRALEAGLAPGQVRRGCDSWATSSTRWAPSVTSSVKSCSSWSRSSTTRRFSTSGVAAGTSWARS